MRRFTRGIANQLNPALQPEPEKTYPIHREFGLDGGTGEN
jgi:hypothetical protein